MAAAKWSDREKYVFKRTIEELGDYRGMGTELVTLYVPPTRQLSDVTQMLRDEVGQSSNIKSKQTRDAVGSALTSIMARLKPFKETPENGLAVFVGNVVVGNNKTEQVAHLIEPPAPVDTYQYRCDSSFNVEPLQGMLLHEETYGLMVIDRKECSIGLLKGKALQVLYNRHSQVPSKHGRGGQSQRRFERLTEEAAHEWFKNCGEKASEMFLAEKNLKVIFLGGPGPTKNYFAEQEYLHHELMKRLHPTFFDTGYTDDDQGLKELMEAAGGAIQGIALVEDKHLVQRFLQEISKRDGGLATYGEAEVRKALEMGAVDQLLLSEDLRQRRITLKHKDGEERNVTCLDKEREAAVKELAGDWEANQYDLESVDLIEDLSNIAESFGSGVHIISGASEEGGILKNAFGGVVAILRYQIE